MTTGMQAGISWATSLSLLLVGAILTLISNFVFRRWQYGVERWNARVDWFCETLTKAADLGVEYWLERLPERSVSKSLKSETVKNEILILGLQERLDGILATVEERMQENDKKNIRKKLGDFRDALTGGSFQTNALKSDNNRARDIQMKASELFVFVREASDRASRFRFWR